MIVGEGGVNVRGRCESGGRLLEFTGRSFGVLVLIGNNSPPPPPI